LPVSVGRAYSAETRTTVLVVGAVHGAAASAADVTAVLTATNPNAVVVELCPDRLTSLQTAMEASPGPTQHRQQRKSSREKWAKLQETFGGKGPAALAFVLTGMYGVQRRAGVDPGCEFKAALAAARCPVICGDANATDTVSALFRSISRPLANLADLIRIPPRFRSIPLGGVFVPRVLLAARACRIREFAGVFAPIGTAVYVLATAVAVAAQDLVPEAASLSVTGAIGIAYSCAQNVLLVYMLLSISAFLRVLVGDRDRVLARAVLDTALDLRREQRESSNHDSATDDGELLIVCVVGLLHVNGIIRYVSDPAGAGLFADVELIT
jgi:pheromone shutdown protein TraB